MGCNLEFIVDRSFVNFRILKSWKLRLARSARNAFVWVAILATGALLTGNVAQGQNTAQAAAQSVPASTGGIHGQVADPTGAVIPGAKVVVMTTSGKVAAKATSDAGGQYSIHGLPAGTYSVTATAQGFAAFSVPGIVVTAGQMKTVNAAMQIAEQRQQVEVQAENTTIGTSPDANASAVILKGEDLNALSDDPDELQNELEALAGPSAGPNGGQIYIDGFTGGQLPPKSSIREIRVNQNPFSAEYDRLGYGRIEIFTKPGTDKLHGQFEVRGNDSAFNSQNPILVGKAEPPYDSWGIHSFIGGPISRNASYFASIFTRNQQNEDILEAIDPTTVTATDPDGVSINEAYGNPTVRVDLSPRVDLQLGKANTLTVRWEYNLSKSTDGGLGTYSLPSQAINSNNQENTLQISDSVVLSRNLVDDIRFQYRRIRDSSSAVSSLPSYEAQGAFSAGGSPDQTEDDHENDFELQDYFSGAYGPHALSFGTRLRAYQDANYTTAGSNGSYIFGPSQTAPSAQAATQNFVGCLDNPPAATCTPQQYTYTQVNKAVARAVPFDAALFYQDDWKISPRFTFSYGVRWETQNWIGDKDDWAPRLTVAYALGKASAHGQPKTVLRAGYGWFYQRFTVANGFGSQTPYVIQTIHENGYNEQQYIQDSGITFNPNTVTPISSSSPGTEAPTFYTISPNMHAANDMEAAVGVDRQLTKTMTGNVTYVFSQGVHQFFTDNLSATSAFPASDAAENMYPATPVTPPTTNNLQYQSGGFYKENQIMATIRASYRRFSFFANYTYSTAKSDTSGVGSVPSVSSDPGLDYGRPTFDVANRFFLFGNVTLPWQISFSPMMVANSGTPYNITIGSDLTGNNQFNARPTYAASCSEAGAVQTQFGCLDSDPIGRNEKIIPYGIATGPANVSVNARLSEVVGLGPKLESGHGAGYGGNGGHYGGPPGLAGGGLSGSRGGPGPMNAAVSRKYSLTFSLWSTNIFNHTNYGTPDGVLSNPEYFGKSQSLMGGFFGSSTAGNRNLFLQTSFNF
jgi:Carboxypeptidase regulatory-like domain